ncbi:MAG: pyridoxamine 5'-phosphate oxidase family protein [Mycobacteriales bacterium]
MHWSEFEHAQPRLAGLARQRLLDPGVVLVVTIRRDGTPRLSPVEPYVLDGDLWLSMMSGSRKAMDLRRDPRILVHGVVSHRDGAEGELKVRGTARAEHDPATHRRYAEAVAADLGWRPEPGRFHLFAVDVGEVTAIRYDAASGDQFVACWPPGREYVRRATSATSVGDPEPRRELIVTD